MSHFDRPFPVHEDRYSRTCPDTRTDYLHLDFPASDGSAGNSLKWSYSLYAALACAVLLKGLIGLVFPLGIFAIYLAITRGLFERKTWRRLISVPGLLLFCAIAVPWHVLAILRNPPYFD